MITSVVVVIIVTLWAVTTLGLFLGDVHLDTELKKLIWGVLTLIVGRIVGVLDLSALPTSLLL